LSPNTGPDPTHVNSTILVFDSIGTFGPESRSISGHAINTRALSHAEKIR
jgi:hypothetical protein